MSLKRPEEGLHGANQDFQAPDDLSTLDQPPTHDQETHAPGTPGVSSSSENGSGIVISDEAAPGANELAAHFALLGAVDEDTQTGLTAGAAAGRQEGTDDHSQEDGAADDNHRDSLAADNTKTAVDAQPKKPWWRKVVPWAAGAVGAATIGGVVAPTVIGGDEATPVGRDRQVPGLVSPEDDRQYQTDPEAEESDKQVPSTPNTTENEAQTTIPENPYETAYEQTIEYSYYPHQTLGDFELPLTPLNPDNNLVGFRNEIGTPDIKGRLKAGEAKIDKGTCVVQSEKLTGDDGETYTLDRVFVNPLTFKEGNRYVYAGVINVGDLIPIATEQDGNTVVKEAVGDTTTRIFKSNENPPIPVTVAGALTPNSDDEPLVSKVISRNELPSNVSWEATGLLVSDGSSSYIGAGIANVVTKGETGTTDSQLPAVCAQLQKAAGL